MHEGFLGLSKQRRLGRAREERGGGVEDAVFMQRLYGPPFAPGPAFDICVCATKERAALCGLLRRREGKRPGVLCRKLALLTFLDLLLLL